MNNNVSISFPIFYYFHGYTARIYNGLNQKSKTGRIPERITMLIFLFRYLKTAKSNHHEASREHLQSITHPHSSRPPRWRQLSPKAEKSTTSLSQTAQQTRPCWRSNSRVCVTIQVLFHCILFLGSLSPSLSVSLYLLPARRNHTAKGTVPWFS